MAIAQRGTATTAATTSPNNASSLSVNKPTGVVSGDLMLVLMTANDESPYTKPTGWTALLVGDNGTNFGDNWFYKVAGGSEGSSYTFSKSAADSPIVLTCIAFSGVDTSTPFGGSNNQRTDSPSSNSYTTPTCTNTASNGRVIYSMSGHAGTQNLRTFTESGIAGVSELADHGTTGASTGYMHVICADNSDFSGGGNPSSLTVTANGTIDRAIGSVIVLNALITSVSPDAGKASATAAALAPTIAIGVNAGVATATAAAYVASNGKNAGAVSATASAKQPTVSTTPHTDASAGSAAASVTVRQTRMDYAPAGLGAASVTVNRPSTAIGDQAGIALATGSAHKPSMAFGVSAGVAQVAATAGSAAPGLALNVGTATLSASAYPATLYFGSSRVIHIGHEARLGIIAAEDRILMVEES